MEQPITPTPARDLRSDTRGAVLLVAVFMSAFLVGGLWYLIGIGDAAVYKQYMQDGADAVAFSSAVYHARGMNVIALINLVMAAVLMVLVAFKIAQLLLIAANIASCLIGAFLNPVCDLTTAAEPEFEVWVNRVETIVDKILRILYQTSNAVAIGMPWVAEGKAVLTAGDYSSTVKGGMMASISLVPGPLESAVGGAFTKSSSAGSGTAPAGGSGGGSGGSSGSGSSGSSPAGMRWGLPVEDDDYANLCKHAGQDVVKFVFLPFGFLGMGGLASGVESFTSGLVGTLVKTFPGYFCGDLKDAAAGLGDTIKKAATDGAKGSIKDMCDKKKADVAKSKDKSGFSYDNCLKAGGKLDSLKSTGSTLGAGKTSKRPYGAALLGDDFYAVWSFDWGSLDDQSGAARGVDVAGWNKAHAGAASELSKIGIAQAEFYYEPRKDGPKAWRRGFKSTVPMMGGGGGMEQEALWNLRWRARLRRVHLPLPSVGGILAEKLGGKIKVPVVGDMLKWPATKLGDMLDSEVKKVLGPVADGIIH